jgi:uncharacterized repeat protein (TIGR01451 family)
MRRLVLALTAAILAGLLAAPAAQAQTTVPVAISTGHGRLATTVFNATNREQFCQLAVDLHYGFATTNTNANASAVSPVGRISAGDGCSNFEIRLLRVGFETGGVVDDCRPVKGQPPIGGGTAAARNNGRTLCNSLHNRIDYEPDTNQVLGSGDWVPIGCDVSRVAPRVTGRVRFANGHLQDVSLRGNYTDATPNGCVADLAISKQAFRGTDPPTSTYVPGERLTFQVNVPNAGPDFAPNVTITDQLGAGLTLVSVPTDLGCVRVDADTMVCHPPSPLRRGFEYIIAYEVQVAANATGELSNQVSVGSDARDPDLSDNTDGVTLTRAPAPA